MVQNIEPKNPVILVQDIKGTLHYSKKRLKKDDPMLLVLPTIFSPLDNDLCENKIQFFLDLALQIQLPSQ
jgi:hypothetical protein